MTKQEEIREELAMVLAHIDGRYWNDLTVVEAGDYIKKTERVVIKMDRKLPAINARPTYAGSSEYVYLKEDLADAGYVAVEPLIGE